MDRTQEFNTVAESVRSKQTAKPVKRSIIHQKSQFALAAAKIGKEISDTSEKLNKLAKLAKRDGVFDDPTVEVEELTYIIKQNIQNLNKEVASLREFSTTGVANKQNNAHSNTVVTYLNTKLANATKDFKEVLQTRTESIKKKNMTMEKFTGKSALSTPTRAPSGVNNSILYNMPESPARTGGEVAIFMPQMTAMVQQEDYTTSRASAVENIERTIVELGGIFQQLATLVAAQGEMIQRIDDNIDNSSVYVEKGGESLVKYLYNVSSNRMLIVKLFLVLIVFAVIFIVFFL